MLEENIYSFADPRFYETISRLPLSAEYTDHLRSLVPDCWQVYRWDVWVGATPPDAPRVQQGFKIHVSSTPLHACRVMDAVIPELVKRNTEFKIAGDSRMLGILLSKGVGRGGAGKFMTIYPSSVAALRELLEALYERTKDQGLAGPYILSDRRYRDSQILYYRYGGFHSTSVLQVDGSLQPVILTPQGEPVPDERLAVFRLPAWVDDPFGGSQSLEYNDVRVLKERYRVDSVIVFSNSGGVYRGTDLEADREVIIKEARPYSHFWQNDQGWFDAIALLEREFRILAQLAPLGISPEPIDFFRQWEHAFLVEGIVPGRTYQHFWADDRNILAPFIHRPGRIERFVPLFRHVAGMILETVERIHERGVILGDLSSTNILLDGDADAPDDLRLGMIDFESAHLSGNEDRFTEFTRQWGTPGYVDTEKRATRASLSVEDDYYAVGMLLYGAVAPVQPFFQLHPGARESYLDRFIELGVPLEAKRLIFALLAGDIGLAKHVLNTWQPG